MAEIAKWVMLVPDCILLFIAVQRFLLLFAEILVKKKQTVHASTTTPSLSLHGTMHRM